MKHLFKRSLSLLLAALLLLCAGCASEPRDERLSLDYAIERMDQKAEKGEQFVLFLRPSALSQYSEWGKIDEAFLEALRLSEWNEVDNVDLNGWDFPEESFWEMKLEYTKEPVAGTTHGPNYFLAIGDHYGGILRYDRNDEERYGWRYFHSGVFFELPQEEDGELIKALRKLCTGAGS